MHLPACVEILYKPEAKAVDILKQVVSDDHFREAAEAGNDAEAAVVLAKGRPLAWGLTYFLIHRKPDRLKAYFEELNKMPRDLPFDANAMRDCFARAVDAVDANRQVDEARFVALANEWKQYLKENTEEAKEAAN